MTNVRALNRVRQDLAAGRRSAAVRRLRAMLAADPGDLDAYKLLTDIYRKDGNPAEAGRWGYLTGAATSEEIAAFELAHPQPWVRLRLLGKAVDPDKLPDEAARVRLAELHEQVTEATIPIQQANRRGRPATHPGAPAGLSVPAPRGGSSRKASSASPVDQGEATTPIPVQRSRAHTAAAEDGGLVSIAATGERHDSNATALTAPARIASGAARRASALVASVAATARGSVGRTRAPHPTPQVRKQGTRARSLGESTRNFLILGLLIVLGTTGSVAAVGGVRAIFGISNWLSPVRAILKSLLNFFTS